MSIFLTGSSGFVGKNLISYFKDRFFIKRYKRDSSVKIEQDYVIHLAGKAHDTKKAFSKRDYYKSNTELTKKVFDSFLESKAKVFIMLSSVKAAADSVEGILFESQSPSPKTDYGKSKLMAENYILSKSIPPDKKFFILRPCMIHGPYNKGNLNLLFNLISKNIPWFLGSFENKRSYCSIENLLFVINEIIENFNFESGIYNVSDDEALSTNEVVLLISKSLDKRKFIIKIPVKIVKLIAKIGDFIKLPLNSERLKKLTESYVVSNKKIIKLIGKPLPVNSKVGLLRTFKSFS